MPGDSAQTARPRTLRLRFTRTPLRERIAQGILLGAAAAAAALALTRAGLLDSFEARTWDLRARTLARPSAATPHIRLILLDQASLDWGYAHQKWNWPWPREVYKSVIDFCRRGGARSVTFDVLFTEPSFYGVDDDAALAASAGDSGCFAGALVLGSRPGTPTPWPDSLRPPPLEVDPPPPAAEPLVRRLRFPRANLPVPEIAAAARALGDVSSAPDPDGVNRRVRLLSFLGPTPIPSLPLAAYLAGGGAGRVTLAADAVTIDGTRVPVDPDGRALLRYRGPTQTHRAVSARQVLDSELLLAEGREPTLDPDFFRDSYVLFGFTAPGLFDLRPSPLGGAYAGVEVHATALDNLLAGDFMRTPPFAGLTVPLVLLLAVAAGVAVRACRAAWQTAAAFVLLLPAPAALGWALYPHGLWLPVTAPTLAIAVAVMTALVVNYASEGRQKKFIKSAFGQYLSPVVIEQLVQNPERLRLGGERREISILFSDLRGFTSISESLSPEALTALLNEYLTAVTAVIYEQGGTIDKYEGDAVIAFWNAPLDMGDHAARSVRAALLYQQAVAAMRPSVRERTGAELVARIGIHAGPVVIGNLGSEQRFNYTFLGDAGNLASRLEGLNKAFGTSILVSEVTRRLADGECPFREISRVAVVGRREPVRVYEPYAPADFDARRATLDAFASGLQLYYDGRFEEAQAVFDPLAGADGPAAAYAARCRALRERPPADWNGVWVMTEK